MAPKGYIVIYVKPKTFEKLLVLKARLRKRSLNDVIEELLKLFQEADLGNVSKVNVINTTGTIGIVNDVNNVGVVGGVSTSSTVTTIGNVNNVGATGSSRTGVFCKKRGEIVDLKHYIEKLEKKGVLVDWWEEGEDAVCFELKSEK